MRCAIRPDDRDESIYYIIVVEHVYEWLTHTNLNSSAYDKLHNKNTLPTPHLLYHLN